MSMTANVVLDETLDPNRIYFLDRDYLYTQPAPPWRPNEVVEVNPDAFEFTIYTTMTFTEPVKLGVLDDWQWRYPELEVPECL